ncbi:MAG: hydroxymethylbilane synthase, partial [Terriglobales bacterium]
MRPALRIGSRGSALARWQAEYVAAALRARGLTVEV